MCLQTAKVPTRLNSVVRVFVKSPFLCVAAINPNVFTNTVEEQHSKFHITDGHECYNKLSVHITSYRSKQICVKVYQYLQCVKLLKTDYSSNNTDRYYGQGKQNQWGSIQVKAFHTNSKSVRLRKNNSETLQVLAFQKSSRSFSSCTNQRWLCEIADLTQSDPNRMFVKLCVPSHKFCVLNIE